MHAYPHHETAMRVAQSRAVWSARTVEGGLDCGIVISAIALSPNSDLGLM